MTFSRLTTSLLFLVLFNSFSVAAKPPVIATEITESIDIHLKNLNEAVQNIPKRAHQYKNKNANRGVFHWNTASGQLICQQKVTEDFRSGCNTHETIFPLCFLEAATLEYKDKNSIKCDISGSKTPYTFYVRTYHTDDPSTNLYANETGIYMTIINLKSGSEKNKEYVEKVFQAFKKLQNFLVENFKNEVYFDCKIPVLQKRCDAELSRIYREKEDQKLLTRMHERDSIRKQREKDESQLEEISFDNNWLTTPESFELSDLMGLLGNSNNAGSENPQRNIPINYAPVSLENLYFPIQEHFLTFAKQLNNNSCERLTEQLTFPIADSRIFQRYFTSCSEEDKNQIRSEQVCYVNESLTSKHCQFLWSTIELDLLRKMLEDDTHEIESDNLQCGSRFILDRDLKKYSWVLTTHPTLLDENSIGHETILLFEKTGADYHCIRMFTRQISL